MPAVPRAASRPSTAPRTSGPDRSPRWLWLADVSFDASREPSVIMAVHAVPEVRGGEPARRDALLELRRLALRRRARGDPRRAAGEDPLPEAAPLRVGRARHNDIALNEPSISKLHARIDYQDGRFFVEDAGSLHGVYVNATKVRRAELAPGRPDPARQRDAEVLAARQRERDRRHGQAALGRAAAAPALRSSRP